MGGGGEAIVISGSPEMGLNDQSASEEVALAESREAFLALVVIQVVHPPKKDVGHSDKTKYTQAGRRRLLLPDWMLLNSYLPHCGPAPPREEVSVLGLEGAQKIIDRWRSFSRGESSADHLHELYLMMLSMHVAVWTRGQGEEYSVSIPAGITKEDLQQMIEDEM